MSGKVWFDSWAAVAAFDYGLFLVWVGLFVTWLVRRRALDRRRAAARAAGVRYGLDVCPLTGLLCSFAAPAPSDNDFPTLSTRGGT